MQHNATRGLKNVTASEKHESKEECHNSFPSHVPVTKLLTPHLKFITQISVIINSSCYSVNTEHIIITFHPFYRETQTDLAPLKNAFDEVCE